MKTRTALLFLLSASITLLFSGCASSGFTQNMSETENEYTSEPVNLETFQESLSDYGQFIKIDSSEVDPDNELFDDENYVVNNNENTNYEENNYGDYNYEENNNGNNDLYTNYIWVPNANNLYEGWNPYSEGRWAWTDWGWTWVSNYSWGRDTYHYGRWWYSNTYGWVWSPGRVWGPGWVNWCDNGSYVGWYPTSPRHHRRNHRTIYVNHHYRRDGWIVIKKEKITDPISRGNIVKGEVRDNVIKTSPPFVNISKDGKRIVNNGPDIQGIEKIKGSKIEKKSLSEVMNTKTSKKENTNVSKTDPNKYIVNEVKNENVTKENQNSKVDRNKKTNETKTKVDNETNNNSTKTKNNTEIINKSNDGTKENKNKKETKKENNDVNKDVNKNKDKTESSYNQQSLIKSNANNKIVNTNPKVSQTLPVKEVVQVKKSPVVKETKQVKQAPIVKETQQVKQAPVVKETREIKQAPVVKESPRVKQNPIVKEQQQTKQSPVVKEVQVVNQTPPTQNDGLPQDQKKKK